VDNCTYLAPPHPPMTICQSGKIPIKSMGSVGMAIGMTAHDNMPKPHLSTSQTPQFESTTHWSNTNDYYR